MVNPSTMAHYHLGDDMVLMRYFVISRCWGHGTGKCIERRRKMKRTSAGQEKTDVTRLQKGFARKDECQELLNS